MANSSNTKISLICDILNHNSVFKNLSDSDKLEALNFAYREAAEPTEIILNEPSLSWNTKAKNKLRVSLFHEHLLSSFIIDKNISIAEVIKDFTDEEKILVHNLALSELSFMIEYLGKQDYLFTTYRHLPASLIKKLVVNIQSFITDVKIYINEIFFKSPLKNEIKDVKILASEKYLSGLISNKLVNPLVVTTKYLTSPMRNYVHGLMITSYSKIFSSPILVSVSEIISKVQSKVHISPLNYSIKDTDESTYITNQKVFVSPITYILTDYQYEE